MNKQVLAVVLIACVALSGCGTEFVVGPMAAVGVQPHRPVTTRDGERRITPARFEAVVVTEDSDDERLGVPPGAGCRRATYVPETHVDLAKRDGWSFGQPRFTSGDVGYSVQQDYAVIRGQRCVWVPLSAVREVKVTDLEAKSRRNGAIAVGATLGGLVMVGLLIALAVATAQVSKIR